MKNIFVAKLASFKFQDSDIVFCNHRPKRRFAYRVSNHKIELPQKRKIKKFTWIIDSISHEYLHKILHEFVDYAASENLDKLGYCLVTGCNYAEQTKLTKLTKLSRR